MPVKLKVHEADGSSATMNSMKMGHKERTRSEVNEMDVPVDEEEYLFDQMMGPAT